MPEVNLKQSEFTSSGCRPFTKKKGRTQKLKETGDTKYFYKNELVFHMIWHMEILNI